MNIDIPPLLTTELSTFSGTRITILKLILFFIVLLAFYFISRLIVKRALDVLLKRRGIEKEARYAVLKLVHYLVVFVGIWAAFNVLGIHLTALIAVAGIAGIVLGFGLQPIIANFISGLILMGERTAQVGDWIEVDGKYGKVIDSGIRSSTIQTIENLHVIVPNRELVEKSFVNYSHQDDKIRIDIPVGVKYGSDVEKVKNILFDIAESHERVLDDPEPFVAFREFGDSSLNFELKCWIATPQYRLVVRSELNFEVNRRFAEEGITIPFPQTDVWLKEQ